MAEISDDEHFLCRVGFIAVDITTPHFEARCLYQHNQTFWRCGKEKSFFFLEALLPQSHQWSGIRCTFSHSNKACKPVVWSTYELLLDNHGQLGDHPIRVK